MKKYRILFFVAILTSFNSFAAYDSVCLQYSSLYISASWPGSQKYTLDNIQNSCPQAARYEYYSGSVSFKIKALVDDATILIADSEQKEVQIDLNPNGQNNLSFSFDQTKHKQGDTIYSFEFIDAYGNSTGVFQGTMAYEPTYCFYYIDVSSVNKAKTAYVTFTAYNILPGDGIDIEAFGATLSTTPIEDDEYFMHVHSSKTAPEIVIFGSSYRDYEYCYLFNIANSSETSNMLAVPINPGEDIYVHGKAQQLVIPPYAIIKNFIIKYSPDCNAVFYANASYSLANSYHTTNTNVTSPFTAFQFYWDVELLDSGTRNNP